MAATLYTDLPLTTEILNKEYNPTLSTQRFLDYPNPFEQVLLNFILVCSTETERVKKLYKVRENVRYGGVDDNQLLDIYYKEEEKNTPLFIFIHGGYWQMLDKSTSGTFVAPLVERGYRVILADYNLTPNVTLEQLTQQSVKLFEWIYKYGQETNTSHISFSAHSAGAHLLMWLLKTPNFTEMPLAKQTKSLFFISGVYDLRELWQLESVNPRNIFSVDAEKAKELSPILWKLEPKVVDFCKQQKIKFHIVAAEHDSTTFKAQSQMLAKNVIANGFPEDNIQFKIFDKYDHFDIIEEIHIDKSSINSYVMKNL